MILTTIPCLPETRDSPLHVCIILLQHQIQEKILIILPSSFRLPQWLSGKESACNAADTGNPGSIPGSGRSWPGWTSIWPSNPTSGHTHQGNQIWKRHMHPNVHRSSLSLPGHGSNLDAHQQTNGQGSCGTYTPWNITQPLKRIHLNQF